jgi:hypothetical protein
MNSPGVLALVNNVGSARLNAMGAAGPRAGEGREARLGRAGVGLGFGPLG